LERRSGGKGKGKGNITAVFLDMLTKPDLPTEQRATLLESVVRSGGAKELGTIFQRVQSSSDPVALKKKTLDWLAEPAGTRKTQPKIDAKEIRALLDKSDLQTETVHLIAAWKATGLAGDLRKIAQDPKAATAARYAALDALAKFADKDSQETLEGVAGPTS